jgi:hypothetical protein
MVPIITFSHFIVADNVSGCAEDGQDKPVVDLNGDATATSRNVLEAIDTSW